MNTKLFRFAIFVFINTIIPYNLTKENKSLHHFYTMNSGKPSVYRGRNILYWEVTAY